MAPGFIDVNTAVCCCDVPMEQVALHRWFFHGLRCSGAHLPDDIIKRLRRFQTRYFPRLRSQFRDLVGTGERPARWDQPAALNGKTRNREIA